MSIFICLLFQKKLRRTKTRINTARLIQFLDLKPLPYADDENMAKETDKVMMQQKKNEAELKQYLRHTTSVIPLLFYARRNKTVVSAQINNLVDLLIILKKLIFSVLNSNISITRYIVAEILASVCIHIYA
jgi:hypothetical protein